MVTKINCDEYWQSESGFPVMLPAAYHYMTMHKYIGQIVENADVLILVLELLRLVVFIALAC